MADTNFEFPSTHIEPQSQTLGGSVIGSFAIGHIFWGVRGIFLIFHNGRHQFCISVNTHRTADPNFWGVSNWEFCSTAHFWGVRAIFLIFHSGRHQFCISVNTHRIANTNFAFLSTHIEPQTQTLGGVSNWEFCSRGHFWGVRAIFLIFHNGRHQFCISVNTRKTVHPNFRGVSNWEFCSMAHFWGVRGVFLIFHNGRHQFCISINTHRTADPNFSRVSNWEFCSRAHFWGVRAIFLIFHNGRHQFCISVNTHRMADINFSFPSTHIEPQTQTLGGSVIGSFA